MNNNQKKPPLSLALIWVFLIVSAIIFITGYRYILNQKKHALDLKNEELLAVANLKSGQIVRWWHERLGDAIIIKENIPLVEEIGHYFGHPEDERSRDVIKNVLGSLISTFDYQNCLVLDTSGQVKLVLPGSDTLKSTFIKSLIPEISDKRKVILTDLHFSGRDSSIKLDLIVPVSLERKGTEVQIATIIMRLDPQKILYPIVESWPTASKSSETLLLRKEGDSILYLNNLRHISNSALRVRRSVSDTNLLGAKAVMGTIGIAEGFDYRGVPVIGAIKKIAGTGWYMVAKVDLKEVKSQITLDLLPVRLMLIFMISAFGAVIGWTIWHQRVRFYRDQYKSELEKMALRKHFDYILKYANDIVLLLDRDLKIVEANDRSLDIYMYSREELVGKDIRMLRLPEYDSQLKEKIAELDSSGTSRYETWHRRKDGSVFQVEISARLFEIEGEKYYQSIGRDITERKGIEARLNELLERYNVAIRAAGLAVWEYDIINDKLIWDDRVYDLYEVDKDGFPPIYGSWLNTLHPDDREEANKQIQNAVQGLDDYNTIFRVKTRKGQYKFIKAYGHVVRDESKSPVRMIGINYDITDQKLSENLLREREFWLSESQKVGKIGSYIFDLLTLTWSSSEVLDELFGIGQEFERTLEGWNSIVHPLEKDEMLKYVKDYVIGSNRPFDKEYRIINKRTGCVHWVYGRGELRHDKDGNPVMLIGTIQDITERKKAELQLVETEKAYSGLFQTVSDAIYIHKTDGVFIDVNEGALKMYGYTLDEMKGMTPLDVGAPGRNNMDELAKILERVYYTGVSEQFEFWGRRKNGEIFPKEVVANKGKYFGQDVIIATARDITLRKNYEENLRQAKEKAEESDRLKTAFLHNISHEIRTPMNAIVGFTALLEDPELDNETRKHFINIISQSTNQLLGIISDIVDISNIEAGQVKLTYSEVNINTVVKNLYDQFRITAERQKVLFHVIAALDDEKAVIKTDKTKLIQVLSNLLNNAFKFTRQGTVQFGYRMKDRQLVFFVKDTGIGVPPEKLEAIFERFYQVENHSSRQYGGAGLGLSISKAYVEMLGGKIWVESKPGKGSEFCFSHPI